MHWTWDVVSAANDLYVTEIHDLGNGGSFELRARSYYMGSLGGGRGGSLMTVSAAWPYLALTTTESPILVDYASLRSFLSRLGCGSDVASRLNDEGVVHLDQNGRKVAEVIDAGFLSEFMDADLHRRVALGDGVQLLISGSHFSSGGAYGAFPGGNDRLLGRLVDGTRFVTCRHRLVRYLESMGQGVPEDLARIPDDSTEF